MNEKRVKCNFGRHADGRDDHYTTSYDHWADDEKEVAQKYQ